MNSALLTLCERFIADRDTVKSTFALESSYLYPVCAAIFTQNGISADPVRLKECKEILNRQVGIFSNFRSTARLTMIAMLAVSEDPQKKLADALTVYDALKAHFMTNSYLPVASMALAELVPQETYGETAARTRAIYKLIREAHPFLTSGEDSVFAALLALSELSDEAIVAETERCYELLKAAFSIGNGVQSLSHVLALCDGTADDKCRKTVELYDKLRAQGCKYGKTYELGTLGVLAMLPERLDVIADQVAETDAWLHTQPGYRFFGLGARQRLMHAGMIVSALYLSQDRRTAMQSAAVTGTVSLIAAQQAAMCAAIAASAAASSAN